MTFAAPSALTSPQLIDVSQGFGDETRFAESESSLRGPAVSGPLTASAAATQETTAARCKKLDRIAS
jgi:hypothetical protein